MTMQPALDRNLHSTAIRDKPCSGLLVSKDKNVYGHLQSPL